MCRFVNYSDAGAAERARQAMNGMRVSDKILHVMVQASSNNVAAALNGSRQHSGGVENPSSANVAAAAAVLAAAAGQPVHSAPGTDWQLMPPQSNGMMW